jgi:hypothetical protein
MGEKWLGSRCAILFENMVGLKKCFLEYKFEPSIPMSLKMQSLMTPFLYLSAITGQARTAEAQYPKVASFTKSREMS